MNISQEIIDVKVKSWGFEYLLDMNGYYALKRLDIKKDHLTSFHYHERKTETFHVISGQGFVFFEDNIPKELTEGSVISIKPYTKHQIVAKTDMVIIEASTPELQDIVRE